MAKTASSYWRALMGDSADNFRIVSQDKIKATDTVDSIYPGDGVLYPRWEATHRTRNGVPQYDRDGDAIIDRADVRYKRDPKGGPDLLQPGHGTSLHDVARFFGPSEFWIPEGTDYSTEIFINVETKLKTSARNPRIQGHHAQLEPAKPMTRTMFEGYLDTMARNAVVRQIELAHGKPKVTT